MIGIFLGYRKWILSALVSMSLDMASAFASITEPKTLLSTEGSSGLESENLWTPPNYSGQESALGYKLGVFSVPPSLESRVSFWIDIYSKYNSSQGVLHDSRYVDIVYEEVSFEDINGSSRKEHQKRKLRRQRVKQVKKEIKERLARLSRLSSPAGLSGEDLRYWYLFAAIPGKDKFRKAMGRNRLRFQLGQKDFIKKGIYSSGKYIEHMEQIFRQEGLPVELTRLPFVESSFNLKARSKVGASGIWQFMRSTGKRYMRINRAVDERNDPIKATRAAAKFFKYNYSVLNDWPLAVTAYNHGAAGVRRQLRRHRVQTLPELVTKRQGRFGFASANFYASFLAVLEVEKNAKKYFGELPRHPKETGEMIRLGKAVSVTRLLSWFGGQRKVAKEYNPHLRGYFWKGWEVLSSRDFVRVPKSKVAVVKTDLKSMKPSRRVATGYYKIRSGETLGGIARRLGVGLKSLMSVNGIKQPRKIQVGQRLVIPK